MGISIAVWIIFPIVAWILASNKGRSRFGWLLLTLLFSPLMVLILLALPAVVDTSGTRVCPYCAENVKAAAKICRYCQRELPERKPPTQGSAQNPSEFGSVAGTVERSPR
jgi:hypothetical protein